MEQGHFESDNARFWDIVNRQSFPSFDAEFEETEQRIIFEINQETADALARVMRQGNTLAQAVDGLLQIGIFIEKLLNDGVKLRAIDRSDGSKVPFSINSPLPTINRIEGYPSMEIDGVMQDVAKIDVATTPERRLAIPLFCEQHNCTPDVAINALMQRGYMVRHLLQNGVLLKTLRKGGMSGYIRLTEQDGPTNDDAD